jgi:enediyne biosynthesis protein E4
LYRNNRDGTFTDVTEKAGAVGNAYGMGVAVGDYDADGFPDVYVTQYADTILYRNNGDGTFTDVSEESGIARSLAKAWGLVAAGINNDGRMDLFVGNDTVPNFLFANRGKGKFEEIGLLAGVGYNSYGLARSGMR